MQWPLLDAGGDRFDGRHGCTVGVTITAVAAPQFTMTMNRPFFYAVRDDDNGALLFVGVLEDPTS